MAKSANNFLTNVLKLLSGSLFSQGLTVAVLPIVARLYAPEALGISAIFLSVTALIGILACLRYEFAIMLPETPSEAANLLGACLFSVVAVTVVTCLAIVFFQDKLVTFFNAPLLSRYVWLIPVAILINGLFLALNYWNSRTKHFGRLSIARVTSSVVSNTARVGFGFAGMVSGGMLILAALLGQFTTTTVLFGQIARDDGKLFRRSISWKGIVSGMRRYRKFPLVSLWSALFNNASRQLPTWILAFYFSPVVVGFFALGRLVLSVPMTFIGTSIGQVFYQRASEDHAGDKDLSRVVEDVFRRLVTLGMFPLLVLTLIGRDAFVVVFGERWAEAGVYVQIMSLMIFFQFISSPLMTLFSVYEHQGTHLCLDALLFGGRAGALIVGGLVGDVRLALFLYTGAGMLYYVLFYLWMHTQRLVHFPFVMACLWRTLLSCAPFCGVLAGCKWGLDLSPLWVVVSGLFCILPYYALVLSQDEVLQGPFRMMLQKVRFMR